MNKNLIIGIILVIAIVGGGYVFLSMNAAPTGTAATTTPTTVTDVTQNPEPTPASSAGVPGVVTDTTVYPTNSTAVVTGKVTPNGAPTTYWYEYGQSMSLGQKTAAQSVGSGFTGIPAPGYITGLAKNATFYFRLSAQNAYGTVTGGTYSFSTNNNPTSQGAVPLANTNAATDVTRTTATVNAHVTPRASQTTYWFEYGDSTDLGSVTSFQSAGNGDTSLAVSAALSGLNPLTKYYFRVNAQNQYGTTNGAIGSFKTSGPAVAVAVPVVTSQVAGPVATTTATLRGTVNPSGSQTTYWFEYSVDSLFGSALLRTTTHRSAGAIQGTVSVQSDVVSLHSGTAYYYRVVAQNAGGTVRSDVQSFTTK